MTPPIRGQAISTETRRSAGCLLVRFCKTPIMSPTTTPIAAPTSVMSKVGTSFQRPDYRSKFHLHAEYFAQKR